MSHIQTEIKPVETFYIVMEDDSNEVLSENGELTGCYSYDEWASIGKFVFSDLWDCKQFSDKKEADAVAKELAKQYGSQFSVLKIVKSQAVLYSLEN